MKRALRNTSRQAPLTPTIPEPSSLPEHPNVAPDLRVEEFLFQSYLREKSRADWAHKRYLDIEEKFEKFRRNHMLRGLGRKMTPSHLAEQDSLKGKK
jgi:hypothetical protein